MATIDGEKRITMLELYNDITAQAWSMFDSDVESEDEFERNVTTSIQKALSDLWNSHGFSFKIRTQTIKTKDGTNNYEMPLGNIVETDYNGKRVYNVFYNNEPLKYDADCQYKEAIKGEPESFYVKQDRIYFYPIPDDKYTISIDYELLYPALDEDNREKGTLENATDYINIPEKYKELFKFTLMPLAMWNYLIASERDENSEAYKIQYERAYKRLLRYEKGMNKDRTIGWRD